MNKKLSFFSLYIALAFIFSYIESIIPFSVGIPGIKLGLANIIIVIVLHSHKKLSYVFIIAIVRIILSGFTFGNPSTMLYSLCGCLLSTFIMILLYKTKLFSPIGISAAGGVAHNIGQLIIAAWILDTKQIIYYLPILVISGLITGIIIGFFSNECLKRLK